MSISGYISGYPYSISIPTQKCMHNRYVNCWNLTESQEECFILDKAPKNDNNWFCSNEITDDLN